MTIFVFSYISIHIFVNTQEDIKRQDQSLVATMLLQMTYYRLCNTHENQFFNTGNICENMHVTAHVVSMNPGCCHLVMARMKPKKRISWRRSSSSRKVSYPGVVFKFEQ